VIFAFVNKVASSQIAWTGVDWMSYLDEDLRLNQINIPGTHDSGTFAIDPQFIPNGIELGIEVTKSSLSKTQYFNIKDQLKMGVRYFNIRVA